MIHLITAYLMKCIRRNLNKDESIINCCFFSFMKNSIFYVWIKMYITSVRDYTCEVEEKLRILEKDSFDW